MWDEVKSKTRKYDEGPTVRPVSGATLTRSFEMTNGSLVKNGSVTKTVFTASPTAAGSTTTDTEYAGWWRRAFASLIDDTIFATAVTISANFLSLFLMFIWHFFFREAAPELLRPAIIFFYIGGPILWWLYVAGFESSLSKGTPGKRLLGLNVQNTDGSPVTFGQVTIKIIVYPIISIIGFFLFAFAAQLAPRSWGLFVALFLLITFFVYLFGSLCFFNKKRQTMIDLINHRVVLYRKPNSVPDSETFPKSHRHEKQLLVCFGLMIALICVGKELGKQFNIDEDFETFRKPPRATVNNSGEVFVAVHDLEPGDLLSKKDFKKIKLPVVNTPLFALTQKDPIDHMVATDAVETGHPLTYGNVITKSFGISDIISIEPLPNRALPTTQEPSKDWNYTPEAENLHDQIIDKNLQAAIEANKSQRFSDALKCCDKAMSQLSLVEIEARDVKSVPFEPKALSTFDFSCCTLGWKTITLSALHERILANIGLGNKRLAQTDCKTALKLVKALHQNLLDEERHIFGSDVNDPVNADQYLQMAANADEKTLTRTFNQLLKSVR